MRIGRWSEPSIVFFVCQLVEMIRDADANELALEDWLPLLDSLVGELKFKITKFEPEMFSNMVSLVSAELQYHTEWCALKSPCIKVSVDIIRWPRE